MTDKLDKLGRKIPQFDRSAAGKKGITTREKNHGRAERIDAASRGGKHRTRGYFGYLKDQGKEEELRELSRRALAARKEGSATAADTVGGESS